MGGKAIKPRVSRSVWAFYWLLCLGAWSTVAAYFGLMSWVPDFVAFYGGWITFGLCLQGATLVAIPFGFFAFRGHWVLRFLICLAGLLPIVIVITLGLRK